ncbi:MAG: hypothetical protein methR_P3820 [Methyloprofundus sp.]|nr:MAG: hypothetical protein methR_P3820 [Methyloprofundus sp.]
MKILYLLICFFAVQVQAEQTKEVAPRLAMGFYYPSLSNVSSRTDIELSLSYWVKELTHKIGLENAYSVLFDDIHAMNSAFEKGQLDMVIAPPLLIANYFKRPLLSDGFMAVKQLHKMDQLVIIARHGQLQATENYVGKRLLLPKNNFLAQIFLESEVLKQSQQPLQQVFSQIDYVNKNQSIILNLFFDKADVAVTYASTLELMVEMNPQVAKKITVLAQLPVKGGNYGYFHHEYALQETLKKEASRFTSEPRGKQILEVFQTSEIAMSYVEDLDSFDRFYQSYLMLKKVQAND